MSRPKPSTEEYERRFWQRVDKTSSPYGCWLWTGGQNMQGYGTFACADGTVGAHRFSWVLHNGTVPAGREICHNCTPSQDFPQCVNPDHLYAGTRADNMRDAWRKAKERDDMSRFDWMDRRHAAELSNLNRPAQAVPA